MISICREWHLSFLLCYHVQCLTHTSLTPVFGGQSITTAQWLPNPRRCRMSHSKTFLGKLHKMLVNAEERCVCCYYYSGGHPGTCLKWASISFLNTFAVGAVTMSAGKSFDMFTTLWLNVKLSNSSLDHSFLSFRECPRIQEVSAIWKKSRHWMPSRDPWKILYTITYHVSLVHPTR